MCVFLPHSLCAGHSSGGSSCAHTQMFCIRFANFLFDRYFESLAPMLRRFPLSIGVIPGIDRAISFSTHPPYFCGMLGLFVPPALPTHWILLTPLMVLAGFLICLVQWPSACYRLPCTSFPMSASRYPAGRSAETFVS